MGRWIWSFCADLLKNIRDRIKEPLANVVQESLEFTKHPVKVIIAIGMFILAPIHDKLDETNVVWIVLILVIAGMYNRFMDHMDVRLKR